MQNNNLNNLRELVKCECGYTVQKRRLFLHQHSSLHQKRLACTDPLIDCECGQSVTKNAMSNHLKSKKHLKLVQSIAPVNNQVEEQEQQD